MFWLEIFGYVASVLIAVSLMMSNIKRLRWINLAGAAAFSLYGFLIGSIPVGVLNGFIAVVDIYYLIRIYQFRDDFDLVRLSSVRTPLFDLLMKKYGDDIREFFPHASLDQLDDAIPLLIFRNMMPVGIFAFRRDEKNPETVEVLIDYVIPESRDFKTARFLFDHHASQLKKESISRLVSHSKRPGHIAYLKRMGFQEENGALSYQL